MPLPNVRVVTAEIQRDGCYLINQRKATAVLPLLWEFPGGRVHDGETDEQALQRAVRERIGVDVTVGARMLETVHEYEEWRVTLLVYHCELGNTEPFANNVAALAWVPPEEFEDYTFPGADQTTIEQLLGEHP
ncbi:MAG: (deoxy)nucleoside triphosphate pyrophosphohydrolase [Deltaproteobacteria bacterium]|nr:MAG: (deoxy)nucleoside triphosphate pyrophosphohydrolase [Deltaproteobacteria bacterium]